LGIKGYEFRQGFLLAAIGHVVLILEDDQRQARYSSKEVAQINVTIVKRMAKRLNFTDQFKAKVTLEALKVRGDVRRVSLGFIQR
jgi:hypothetical protein